MPSNNKILIGGIIGGLVAIGLLILWEGINIMHIAIVIFAVFFGLFVGFKKKN